MKRYLYLYMVALAGLTIACDSFVELGMPPHQMSAEEVFNDEMAATAAISGIYARMAEGNMSARMQIALAVGADELDMRLDNEDMNQFHINNIQIDNGLLSGLWSELYAFIYQANMAVERLQTSTIRDPLKSQLLGEAKFIRAFCYFYLVNLWGDVPLITETDFSRTQSVPRMAQAAVYGQMVADLQDAKALMGEAYPTTERARPNSYGASALLARVQLYVGNWEEAAAEASRVIANDNYRFDKLTNVFLKTSSETIWQLMSRYTYTNIGQQLVPWTSTRSPNYLVSEFLRGSFAAGDARQSWINRVIINDVELFYPYKYRLSLLSQVADEYLVVFGLAEQYLIRAEARIRLNRLEGEEGGLADLEAVRAHAGLTEAESVPDQEEILECIAQERQIELVFEWGHRWLDLKRTGKIDEVMGQYKQEYWQQTDAFWPIPLSQLRANPFLIQNDGYPTQ